MEPRLFVATKAFIARDGKILVLREAGAYADGTNAGRYGLVGGRIAPGEHLPDALRREVMEESGLEVEIGAPVFADESLPRPVVRGEEWQVIKIYFACEAREGEVRLSQDHDDFRWIDPRDHQEENLIENEHAAFEAYLKAAFR